MSPKLPDLPDESWNELERRVAAFESAWRRGRRTSIDDHLTPEDAANERLIFELVHTELELRIKAGEPATAESYLAEWPAIARHPGAADELRAAERRLRERSASSGNTRGTNVSALGQTRTDDVSNTNTDDATVGDANGTGDSGTSRAGAGDHPADSLPSLPGYRLIREVGRGGMGIVYEAVELALGRIVAIKTGRSDSNLRERGRLRREAESAARLQHPNVAQVFQAVEHRGRLYVISEYLPGGTLADRIAARPLAAKAAAALLEPLARAVAYAHSRGVIHRDLKPANVLFSADGTPKVADFGLAKRVYDDAEITRTGMFSGSPAYMAPEQAAGGRDVGPETDVWSLGIILYELLTGRPPFRAPTVFETIDQLRTADPVSPRTLVLTLPRDLETVCLKCLEKSPAGRYATAKLLADDLGRFGRDEPVAARPIGIVERTRRWSLRHRGVAVLALLLIVTLAGAAGAVAAYAAKASRNALLAEKNSREAYDNRVKAERLAAEASEYEQHALDLLFVADVRRASDAVSDGLPAEADSILESYDADTPRSDGFAMRYLDRAIHVPSQRIDRFDAQVWFVALSPDGQTLAACGATGEIRLYETATWKRTAAIEAGQGEVNGLAFSRDGSRLASAGDDGSVVLWNLATGQSIWKTKLIDRLAFEVAFGLDETVLAVCGRDHDIHLVDAATGKSLGTLSGHTDWVQSLAATPDGTTLFSTSEDGYGFAWDLAARKPLWKTSIGGAASRMTDVAVSHDGSRVAFGAVASTVSINDVKSGKVLYQGGIHATRWEQTHSVSFRSVAFLPDIGDLMIAAEGGTVARTRLIKGLLVPPPDAPRPLWAIPRLRVRSIAVHGDDLVTASDEGFVEAWHFRRDLPWRSVPIRGAWDVAWHTGHDGQHRIAVASEEGPLLVDPVSLRKKMIGKGKTTSVAVSSGNGHLLFGMTKGSLQAFDCSSATPQPTWNIPYTTLLKNHLGLTPDQIVHSDVSVQAVPGRDERFIASFEFQRRSQDRSPIESLLLVFDARTGQVLKHRSDVDLSYPAAISGDGNTLAEIGLSGRVVLIDAETLETKSSFIAHHDSASAVAFCRLTGLLATAGHDLKIALWRGGQRVRDWPSGIGRTAMLEFSPDGQTLLSASRERGPQLWDVATGRLILKLDGKPASSTRGGTGAAGFSPDGRYVAVGSEFQLAIFDGRAR